jgi:beta-glucosidase
VQAWYPGQEGGTAVADVLFGDYNPSGKLPITFYKNSNQLPDYEDYSMKGRTYRYFTDALFPFGYGLSYTNFEITKAGVEKNGTNPTDWTLTAEVANTGKRDGTETIQVYIRNLQDAEGPLKTLRGFERIDVKAGQKATATIQLNKQSFEFWDPETNTMNVKPGKYEILVNTSSNDQNSRKIAVNIP